MGEVIIDLDLIMVYLGTTKEQGPRTRVWDSLNETHGPTRWRRVVSTLSNAGNKMAFSAIRYGPGESVAFGSEESLSESKSPPALQGDFLLTHSSGIFGTLIRFGQRFRYWGRDRIFAHWSHAAIFINDSGEIIEALGGGVQQRNVSVYRDTEYVVVHLSQSTAPLDRGEAVKFACYCLHEKYGWLTIFSIAISLLSASKLNFSIDGQQICSALVARSLERIGEIFTENEPWHLMPADLAKHFKISETGGKGQVPPAKLGVVSSSRPGNRKSVKLSAPDGSDSCPR